MRNAKKQTRLWRCQFVLRYQKTVCAVPHNSTIVPQCGTLMPCSVPTVSRQANWLWSSALERMKLAATNELHDPLHLHGYAAQCFSMQVTVNDSKLPINKKVPWNCPKSCAKPTFGDQNWWHIIGCQEIQLLPQTPSALNLSFRAKVMQAPVVHLHICLKSKSYSVTSNAVFISEK